ncbi:3'-5' exonuclease, partial [Pseudomonas syringae pv. tagetis]
MERISVIDFDTRGISPGLCCRATVIGVVIMVQC